MNYMAEKKRARAAQPLLNANTAAAQAQAQEVQEQARRRRELESMFQGRYDNADSAWTPGMAGSSGPESKDAYANLVRASAMRGLAGMDTNPGTGLAQSMGSQNFLEGQQGGQDITASAEALADSIFAKYGQGQDGNYTSPGYQGGVPQLSDSIGFIDEPQNKYTPPPLGDF
jgi:hypothetical protein